MNKSEPIVSDKIKILTCDERIIYNTASVWNTSKLVFIFARKNDHLVQALDFRLGLDIGDILWNAGQLRHVIFGFGLDILFQMVLVKDQVCYAHFYED